MQNHISKFITDRAGKRLFQLSFITLLLIGLFAFTANIFNIPTVNAASGCASSSPSGGAYTVTLCFSTPDDGDSLTGNVTVTATATVSGDNPGIQRLVFYLNNVYLLTDFQSPYSFTFPTARWVDGSYNLAVEALMRDGFTTPNRGSVNVTFDNEITTPPVNKNTFTPALGTNPGSGNPLIVAAAGDGAAGEINSLNVINLISSWNPNLFLYLGDVYEKGSTTEFSNWYGTNSQYFSKFNTITDPTIGNHEYENGVAPGYFDYWNNIPSYYSFTTSGWHFVSLNANPQFNQYSTSSAQYKWLAADLAANTTACTLAFWHEPLYNIGAEGSESRMATIWSLLVQDKVDIVLNGHDHDYQRWEPLDGSGNPDPSNGVTEIIVGTAGHGIQTFTTSDIRVVKQFDSKTSPKPYGALRLQLYPDSAVYQFINNVGSVLDSGTIVCKKDTGPTPTPLPTATNTSTITPTPSRTPTPTRTATFTRTPTNTRTPTITRTPTNTRTPTMTRTPTNTRTPTKTSAPTNTPTITRTPTVTLTPSLTPLASNTPTNTFTPSPTSSGNTITFTPIADSYVNSSSPTSNYGTSTTLRADGSPDEHSYIKFNVTGLSGSPSNVTLRLFFNSTSTTGVNINGVSDTSWGETTITYNSMPAIDGLLAGSSGAIKTSSTWASIDITSLVSGNGTFSIAVTTTNSTAISLASRESGANAPQLVITP